MAKSLLDPEVAKKLADNQVLNPQLAEQLSLPIAPPISVGETPTLIEPNIAPEVAKETPSEAAIRLGAASIPLPKLPEQLKLGAFSIPLSTEQKIQDEGRQLAEAAVIEQGAQNIDSEIDDLKLKLADKSLQKEQVDILRNDVRENLAKNLQQPSLEEIQIKAQPIRDAKAQVIAEQAELDNTQKQNEEIIKKSESNLENFGPESISDIMGGDDWKAKLKTGIAILLGGVSQGLLRTAENPVIRGLEQQFQQNIIKRKLSAEQREAAKEALYNQINQQLKIESAKLDNVKTKAEIEKIRSEIEGKAQDARQRQIQQLSIQSGQAVDPDILDKDDRDRVVRLPDGSFRLAANKSMAEDLNKFRNDVEPAIDGAKRVIDFAKSANKLNLADRARIGVELQALVGQLRLPFVGPGALTDKEYERIQSTLGDPNAIFALKDVELKKLNTVLNKLDKDLKGRYSRAGIDLPKTNEEQLVERLQKKGYNKEIIEKALNRIKNN